MWRAKLLRYAAVQFLVLTTIAMAVYAGGTWYADDDHYHFTENFLSDLGMTHVFSGRENYTSSVLFGIALGSIGAALVAFAWSWKRFAFAQGRTAFAGHASAVLGTLSGLAFMGVAVTPWDKHLDAHNACVVCAFGFLMLYVTAITVAFARNEAIGKRFAVNLFYLAVIVGYIATILFGPRLTTRHGHDVQVVAQKIVAYASMLHVIFLTTSVLSSSRTLRDTAR